MLEAEISIQVKIQTHLMTRPEPESTVLSASEGVFCFTVFRR